MNLKNAMYDIFKKQLNTQEYFGFAEDTRLGRVCEAQISKNTQAYRSGHNEAVLKTSRIFRCDFSKTLDFIEVFGCSSALCEKPFSQFSRNLLASFSHLSRNFLQFFCNIRSVSNPFLKGRRTIRDNLITYGGISKRS